MPNNISLLDECAMELLLGGTQGSGGSGPDPDPGDPPPDDYLPALA